MAFYPISNRALGVDIVGSVDDYTNPTDYALIPVDSFFFDKTKRRVLYKPKDGSLAIDNQPDPFITERVNEILPKTKYPSGTLANGYKVALTGTGTLHASYGTIAGLAKNDIIEKITGGWQVAKAAANYPRDGQLRIVNAYNNKIYQLDKVADTYRPLSGSKNGKMLYLDASIGLDEVTHGTADAPIATLENGLTVLDNSGCRIQVMPGTHGSGESVTLSKQNLVLQGGRGNANQYLNKHIQLHNYAIHQHLVGLGLNTVISNSVGNNFITDCSLTAGSSLTKSGTGYLEVKDSDISAALTSFSGAGRALIQGGFVGYLTVSNALAQVALRNNGSGSVITLTAGVLLIANTTIYAPDANTFAALTSAGTFLYLINVGFANPDGSDAKINIGGFHLMQNVTYNKALSTVNEALSLSNVSVFSALRSFGLIEANAGIKNIYDQNKAYAVGTETNRHDCTQWRKYINKTATTAGEAWNAAKWDEIGGSGSGGGSFTLIKKYPEAILNTAIAPTYQTDGKSYVFTNVSNLNTGYYPISDSTTPQEGDIYLYNGTTGQYSRDLAVSSITTNGDYLINVTSENETYSYYTVEKWKKFLTSTTEKFKAKGDVTKHFGGNFLQPDQAGVRLVEQVKLASTATAGNYGYTEVSFDKVQIVQDGARSLLFRRYNVSNNYGFYGHTTSTGTITPLATAYTNVFSGIVAEAKSFALLQNDYLAHVLLVGGGANRIDVVPQSWNAGTNTYTTGTTLNIVASGVTSMRATMNANNVITILYTTASGLYEIHVLCAGATLSKGTATLITASVPQYYDVFTSGTGGRYMYVYSTDSNVFNYITYDVTTGFVRTAQTTAAVINGLTQPNNNEVYGIQKSGEVILHWKRIGFGTYCKIFNLQTNVLNETSQISSDQLDIRLSYGANSGVGCAVGIFPDDAKPRVCGWVKSGNGISLAEPSVITGTYQNISTALGFGITWTGTQFISAYGGQVSGGISPQTNPVYAEMTLSTVTQLAEVTPDCIIQQSAVDGSIVEVALPGQISKGHTGIIVGQVYCLLGGRLTTIDTGIQIGEGISDSEIFVFNDFNNNNERINNLIATQASQSSTISGHETRITAVENITVNAIEKPIYISQGGATLFILTNKGRLLAATGSVNSYWNTPGTGILKSISFNSGNYDSYQARGIENARQVLFIGSDGKNNTSKVRQVVNLGWTVAVVLEDNTLWGWGDNIGMLANGTSGVNSLTPILLNTGVRKIWENLSPADVNNSGRVSLFVEKTDDYSWGVGNNYYGHFGLGNTAGNGTDTGQNWKRLDWIGQNARGVYPMGNYYHSLLVEKYDGVVVQTGYNADGCMGNGGNQVNQINPVDITTNLKGAGNQSSWSIIKVFGGRGYTDAGASGNATTIVHLNTGTGKVVKTAGSNTWGSLGTGGGTNTTYGWFTVPTNAIAGSSGDYIDLVAGGGAPMTAIAIKNKLASSQPELVGWGYNGQYNIDETNTQRNSPIGIIAYSSTLYPTKILNTRLGCYYTYQYYPDQIMVEFMENGKKVYYMHGRNTEGECGNGTTLNNNVNPWSKVLFPDGVNITLIGKFSTTDGAAAVMVAYDDANNRWYAWG